jgi:ATP-dependent Clp protease adaptor protein ClpS
MGTQTKTVSHEETQVKYPARYQVIIHNDDYTPMDFVIRLLVEVFGKDVEAAFNLTEKVHHEGAAVAGLYSREIADQKVLEGTKMARAGRHPLKLTTEPLE